MSSTTSKRANHERVEVAFQTQRYVGDSGPEIRSVMQIAVVLHGTGRVQVGNDSHDFDIGDVIVVRPGAAQHFSGCEALQFAVCSFDPQAVFRYLGEILDRRALGLLMHAEAAAIDRLNSERLRAVASIMAGGSRAASMGNVGRLLLLLEAVVEVSEHPQPHAAVLKTLQTLDSDIKRDWSLPELAEQLHLDPSYLARLFKTSLGIPPIAYLALMRAETAVAQLASTDLSCSAVGALVGWGDPNYFSRRFRQHFGESPTAYKARLTA